MSRAAKPVNKRRLRCLPATVVAGRGAAPVPVRRRTVRIGHWTYNGHIALARFPPDGTFGWQRVHPKVPLGGNVSPPGPANGARKAVPQGPGLGKPADIPLTKENGNVVLDASIPLRIARARVRGAYVPGRAGPPRPTASSHTRTNPSL
jgi:hypothetical protein